jgi:HAD superfamily hydrolase (TIGR01662 family)
MLGKIVIVMGFPASGKSTYAHQYQERGYYRLNRDELGGSLDDLVLKMENLYNSDQTKKFVLDNTYATKKSRSTVIKWAKAHKFEVYCNWLDVDIGVALYNASQRMIHKYGKLLMPEEIKAEKDPSIYPPVAIYRSRKIFEVPKLSEGFHEIKKIPFQRQFDPKIYKNRALIFDYDGTLRTTISGEKYPLSPDDIKIFPQRASVVRDYHEQGYRILGVSNMSLVAKKKITLENAIECYKYTNQLLEVPIEYSFCPHPAFPQICYCRKPMPGLGVAFIEKHKLNPVKCTMIGDMKTDKTFAERCGFQFTYADDFFTK